MQSTQRIIARLLIVSLVFVAMPLPPAHAALIATDTAIAGSAPLQTSRERIAALLARADVRAALEKNGVKPEEAVTRADALSDDEVDQLASRLDSLPAGGDFGGIIGAAVFIFVVLLITDILGFTKVFSFTRSIK